MLVYSCQWPALDNCGTEISLFIFCSSGSCSWRRSIFRSKIVEQVCWNKWMILCLPLLIWLSSYGRFYEILIVISHVNLSRKEAALRQREVDGMFELSHNCEFLRFTNESFNLLSSDLSCIGHDMSAKCKLIFTYGWLGILDCPNGLKCFISLSLDIPISLLLLFLPTAL